MVMVPTILNYSWFHCSTNYSQNYSRIMMFAGLAPFWVRSSRVYITIAPKRWQNFHACIPPCQAWQAQYNWSCGSICTPSFSGCNLSFIKVAFQWPFLLLRHAFLLDSTILCWEKDDAIARCGLSCWWSEGKYYWHILPWTVLSTMPWPFMTTICVPARLEPLELSHNDGKQKLCMQQV